MLSHGKYGDCVKPPHGRLQGEQKKIYLLPSFCASSRLVSQWSLVNFHCFLQRSPVLFCGHVSIAAPLSTNSLYAEICILGGPDNELDINTIR